MIRELFNAITPENIKSIDVVKDAMDIFIELIEQDSNVNINIGELYTLQNDTIKTQLAKKYLKDLYQYINTVNADKLLYDRLSKLPNDIQDTYLNIQGLKDAVINMSEEDYQVIKNFKENKGTFDALNYIYSLVKRNTTSTNYDENNYLTLTKNSEFEFTITGSVDKTLYDSVIAPISQPLGFILKEYINIVTLPLQDDVYFNYTYENLDLDIFNRFDVKVDSYDFKEIKKVEVYSSNNFLYNKIYFSDDTLLDYNVSLGTVFYKSIVNGVETIVKNYTTQGKCYVVSNYTLKKSYSHIEKITDITTINMTLAEYLGKRIDDSTIINNDWILQNTPNEKYIVNNDDIAFESYDINGNLIQ